MIGDNESKLLEGLLEGKDQNYKLAYLMALKAAASGNEKMPILQLFINCMKTLDAADAARGK